MVNKCSKNHFNNKFETEISGVIRLFLNLELNMRRILIFIIILSLSLGGYFLYQKNKRQDQIHSQIFDTVMSEKIEELYIQARNWKKPLNFNVPDPRLEGDYKLLAEFILSYWVDNIEARNYYLRQLDQADWNHFLSAKRFEQDKKNAYQQTEQMLIDVSKAMIEYEKKQEQIYTVAVTQVNELKIKKSMQKSMREKLIYSREHNDERDMLQIEQEIYQNAEAMFALLKSHQWIRKDKTFLFAKDEQVKQFNLLYTEILKLQSQADELKKHNANVLQNES